MSDGGKGSAPRPIPDREKFEENFERIFGKKPVKDTSNDSTDSKNKE
jgi:hypothetical protein